MESTRQWGTAERNGLLQGTIEAARPHVREQHTPVLMLQRATPPHRTPVLPLKLARDSLHIHVHKGRLD